jgi:hypothetical protein
MVDSYGRVHANHLKLFSDQEGLARISECLQRLSK